MYAGDGLVNDVCRHALWAVTSLSEPRPQRFAVPPLADPPHAMAIMEPEHTLSGCLEVAAVPVKILPTVVSGLTCRMPWPLFVSLSKGMGRP